MILEVAYKPSFTREFGVLDPRLQEEVLAKIGLFRNPENHRTLRVHKLKGPLAGRYSFSVNYKYRIVFQYESKTTAVLLAVGDHAVYQ